MKDWNKNVIVLFVVLSVLTGCQSQQRNAWEQTCKEDTIEAYREYLQQYPEGSYVKRAEHRLRIAESRQKCNEALKGNSLEVLIECLDDVYKDYALVRDLQVPIKTRIRDLVEANGLNSSDIVVKFVVGYHMVLFRSDSGRWVEPHWMREEFELWPEWSDFTNGYVSRSSSRLIDNGNGLLTVTSIGRGDLISSGSSGAGYHYKEYTVKRHTSRHNYDQRKIIEFVVDVPTWKKRCGLGLLSSRVVGFRRFSSLSELQSWAIKVLKDQDFLLVLEEKKKIFASIDPNSV